MNREKILSALPTPAEFSSIPDHKKKEIVENLFSSILDEFNGDHREPDQWEAEQLSNALGALVSDWYNLAITNVQLTLAPPENRANPDNWIRRQDTLTAGDLRNGLNYVSSKPARNR